MDATLDTNTDTPERRSRKKPPRPRPRPSPIDVGKSKPTLTLTQTPPQNADPVEPEPVQSPVRREPIDSEAHAVPQGKQSATPKRLRRKPSENTGPSGTPDVSSPALTSAKRSLKKKKRAGVSPLPESQPAESEEFKGLGMDADDYVQEATHHTQNPELAYANQSTQMKQLYVEDAKGFKAANEKNSSNMWGLRGSKAQKSLYDMYGSHPNDMDEDTAAFQTFLNRTAGLISVLFLFVQGVLGGFTVLNYFYLTCHDSDVEYIAYYSPMSAHVCRAYYFLSMVAFLGACDKYKKDQMTGWYTKHTQRYYNIAICICFLLCFMITCITSEMDQNLFLLNKKIPGWWNEVPFDDDFKNKVSVGKVLNFVRMFFAFAGWILAAADSPSYPFNASNKLLLHLSKGIPIEEIDLQTLRPKTLP